MFFFEKLVLPAAEFIARPFIRDGGVIDGLNFERTKKRRHFFYFSETPKKNEPRFNNFFLADNVANIRI